MEQPSGKMFAGEFLRTFWNYFNQTVDLDQLDKQLAGIIQVCHMWLPEVSWCDSYKLRNEVPEYFFTSKSQCNM
jgi:hypothetical protein